jgi:gamma-glutamylputrescine oxidase
MADAPASHTNSWYAASAPERPLAPAAQGELRTDVCIIGAGFTGLSAALHLAEANVPTLVLEARRVGWGASGRNGGQLHPGFNKSPIELRRNYGNEVAAILGEIAHDARALLHDLRARMTLDCNWRAGLLTAIHKPRHNTVAQAYVEDRLTSAPSCGCTWLNAEDTAARLGTNFYAGGIFEPDGGHLHPLRFCLGLARLAEDAGACLCENSPAQRITRCAEGFRVETSNATIIAREVILACNGYVEGLEPEAHKRILPVKSFIIATEPLTPALQPLTGSWAAADDRFFLRYWRQSHDGRLLFGGGDGYHQREDIDIAGKLRRNLAELYPHLAALRIDYAWGGNIALTLPRLPMVRRLTSGVLAAGGYSGNGLDKSLIAGRILASAIKGDDTRLAFLSRLPCRVFPGGEAARFPLLFLAMTWYAFRDWLG